jgi:hypothetical protein
MILIFLGSNQFFLTSCFARGNYLVHTKYGITVIPTLWFVNILGFWFNEEGLGPPIFSTFIVPFWRFSERKTWRIASPEQGQTFFCTGRTFQGS